MNKWQDISTAPTDGSHVWLFARSIGEPVLARWIAPVEFLSDDEFEAFGEDDWFKQDWFYLGLDRGGRFLNDVTDGEPIEWYPADPPQR